MESGSRSLEGRRSGTGEGTGIGRSPTWGLKLPKVKSGLVVTERCPARWQRKISKSLNLTLALTLTLTLTLTWWDCDPKASRPLQGNPSLNTG